MEKSKNRAWFALFGIRPLRAYGTVSVISNEVRNLSYPDHDRIGKISRCARHDNDKIKGRDRPEDVQQLTNRGFFRALKPSIATQSLEQKGIEGDLFELSKRRNLPWPLFFKEGNFKNISTPAASDFN